MTRAASLKKLLDAEKDSSESQRPLGQARHKVKTTRKEFRASLKRADGRVVAQGGARWWLSRGR